MSHYRQPGVLTMCSTFEKGVVNFNLFLKNFGCQLFSRILTIADDLYSFSFLSMNVSIASDAAEMMSETFISA